MRFGVEVVESKVKLIPTCVLCEKLCGLSVTKKLQEITQSALRIRRERKLNTVLMLEFLLLFRDQCQQQEAKDEEHHQRQNTGAHGSEGAF